PPQRLVGEWMRPPDGTVVFRIDRIIGPAVTRTNCCRAMPGTAVGPVKHRHKPVDTERCHPIALTPLRADAAPAGRHRKAPAEETRGPAGDDEISTSGQGVAVIHRRWPLFAAFVRR